MNDSLVEHVARAEFERDAYYSDKPWDAINEFAKDAWRTKAEVVVAAIFDPDTGWLTRPEVERVMARALNDDLAESGDAVDDEWARGRVRAALAAAVRVSGDDK